MKAVLNQIDAQHLFKHSIDENFVTPFLENK